MDAHADRCRVPGAAAHRRAHGRGPRCRRGPRGGGAREAAEPHSEFATDGWGLFEYTSRGPIDAEGAGRFAALIGTSADDSGALAGQRFEVPVCFIYHVDATGQIDEVREYLGRPAITLPLTG